MTSKASSGAIHDPAGAADPGSFRDRSGRVFIKDGRVFRSVMASAHEEIQFVLDSGLFGALTDTNRLVALEPVETSVLADEEPGAAAVFEHPRLDHVSYPYEWSFSLLKAAALLQLDVHLEALRHQVTLSDATAYNIQFRGPEPVFIDHLSFRRYREGEYWAGHRQFTAEFLAPLLLRALLGVPHNAWFRGSMDGIAVEDLNRLLPLSAKLSWNVLTHVCLQARLQRGADQADAARAMAQRKLPRVALERMLTGLQHWIERLQPADTGKTTWQNYVGEHSYDDEELATKRAFVDRFVRASGAGVVWDIGCNTGDYSAVALAAGARTAIGFDADHGALELAYARARSERANLLPLWLDAANPSPDQGWGQVERQGLGRRASGDCLLALAVVHHLAIARNVPLEAVIDWLVSLAPAGVIEFVPREDPMVQRLLRLREDIFDDYHLERFRAAVRSRAALRAEEVVSKSGRTLIAYER